MQRRLQHRVDDLARVPVLRQVRAQQFDVADDHGQDVVEIVRDAAGQLADRFHLLRTEQRLARLLECLPRLTQFGDVVRDAEHADDFALPVPIDTLRDEIRLRRSVLDGRDALEGVRVAGRNHLAIVLDEPARGLGRIQLVVVLPDDGIGRLPEKPRHRFVDQHVSAVEIFDEDRVGRGVDDRLEDLRAVRDRHKPVTGE